MRALLVVAVLVLASCAPSCSCVIYQHQVQQTDRKEAADGAR